ncbi:MULTISPECIES: DUF2931 family protein [Marinobacter]|uniref:DUF2931 family protein n=1 Tax=Marinobacter xiaoshiensis TaxID=3073652 RepID=A0ABU2HJ70_9GAMM|nr:DUF2931 family protein [Marinobacter sp. F60267]MDS1311106.1 DUF2931 family protein [Marinobacter sp. F60267]
MSIKTLAISFCVLALLGCSDQSESEVTAYGPNSNYRSIGVVAPEHYDVWVDKFFIESLSEDIGWRRPFGIVTCCWKSPPLSRAEWQTTPELFLIRWFSFAEQQSYEAVIRLENAAEIVEKMKEPAPYERYGKTMLEPRDTLVLGLAPGGTVVLWIMNVGKNAIEVGRYSARKIETHPEHYREITERYKRDSQEYIYEHGIPVDDW